MTITIYHNPKCGTSRNVLATIRERGVEPVVIEYLKTPPTRERLQELIAAMGIEARALMRRKEAPYAALGLDDPRLTEDEILDAMVAIPILIQRPIVVTAEGRPSLPPQGDRARYSAVTAGEHWDTGGSASRAPQGGETPPLRSGSHRLADQRADARGDGHRHRAPEPDPQRRPEDFRAAEPGAERAERDKEDQGRGRDGLDRRRLRREEGRERRQGGADGERRRGGEGGEDGVGARPRRSARVRRAHGRRAGPSPSTASATLRARAGSRPRPT